MWIQKKLFSNKSINTNEAYALKILFQNVQRLKDKNKIEQAIAMMKEYEIDIFLI